MTKPKIIYDYFILIHEPAHPKQENGYVPEHILVAENVLGRYLTQDEEIRHINGNTQDNRPTNLEIISAHSGYRVLNITEEVETRKSVTKTFVPCRFQRPCWKQVRAPIARKHKVYIPYICSYQTEGDVYKCSRFWHFLEEAMKEETSKNVK
jgi:hypothetical protein